MRKLFYILTFILMTSHVFAQSVFEADEANIFLAKIESSILKEAIKADQLQNTLSKLEEYKKQANECIAHSDAEIDKLNKQQEKISKDNEALKVNDVAKKFYDEKISSILKERNNCQLFVLKSGDSIKYINKKLAIIEADYKLLVGDNVWKNIQGVKAYFNSENATVPIPDFIKLLSVNTITLRELVGGITIMLLLFAFGYFNFPILVRSHHNDPNKHIANQIAYMFSHSIIRRKIVVIVSVYLLFASLYFYFFESLSAIGLLLFVALFVYTICLILVDVFIFQPDCKVSFSILIVENAVTLARRVKILLLLSLCGGIIVFSYQNIAIDYSIVQLCRKIFITLVMLNLIYIVKVVASSQLSKIGPGWIRMLSSSVIIVTLLCIIILELFGYVYITNFLLKGVISSMVLLVVAMIFHKIVFSILENVSNSDDTFYRHIRTNFGLKKYAIYSELIWLRGVMFVTIWGMLAISVWYIWGLTLDQSYFLYNKLISGFELFGINIIPTRILFGTLIFIFLTLMTRWVRRLIAIQKSEFIDKGERNSLAAIVGYIGFTFSLIIALYVVGINLTGVAFIAGALSVGIGFGLQNIVNNFVSGIILLLERPINPGDRVIVGDIEGHVKKISIRSTIIRSLDRNDVIIPNSELISGKVVNLMFGDNFTRLRIFVGVAYDSDTDLVQAVLLEVAHAHDEVINDDFTKPMALFNRFGDSSLEFELRVVIKDVNRRQRVRSELHVAIKKAFERHHIDIPYPIRDIRIRGGDSAAPLSDL